MVYLPHCQITCSGVLGNSTVAFSEIFSFGFQISDTNFADIPSDSQVDDIAAAIAAAFGDSAFGINSNAFLTRVRVASIDAAGHVRVDGGGAFIQKDRSEAVIGGGPGSPWMPFQVARVITLHTSRAGRSGRGRMYLPSPFNFPDATGMSGATAAQSAADRSATMLQAVNTALGSGAYLGEVVVASKNGFLSAVTAVRAGRVLDTQRRRRNALSEDYRSATV